MKIRKYFVTNSSSSSFILGFKDEDSIAKTLADDKTCGYFETIYRNCMDADKMDLESMLNEFKEDIYWDVKYDLIETLERKGMSWNKAYEYSNTEEFKKLCEEEIDNRINQLKKDAEGNSIFVEIEYEDHSSIGSELEHDVVPYLNCCLRRLSHH